MNTNSNKRVSLPDTWIISARSNVVSTASTMRRVQIIYDIQRISCSDFFVNNIQQHLHDKLKKEIDSGYDGSELHLWFYLTTCYSICWKMIQVTGRTFREPLFAKHISNCTTVIFVPAKDATRWNGNKNSLSSSFWDGLTSSECWWRLCQVQGSLGHQSFFQSHPCIHGGSNLCASLWNPATL